MAVEKVNLPLGISTLPTEAPTEGMETNLTKINPFVTSSDKGTSPVQLRKTNEMLFGSGIVTEPSKKSVSKGHELPTARNCGPLGILSNYWKSYTSKVNEYDAAVGVVSKYMIPEGDMSDIINSNPRIWAIMKQGGIA